MESRSATQLNAPGGAAISWRSGQRRFSANDSPTTRHGNLIAASRRLRPMLERAGSCASADNGNALVGQFAARRGLCNFPVLCLLLKLLSPAPLGPIHD